MGFLSWIIFGALAGWVASLIAGTNERQGCLMNIVVGIVGAFLGGLVVRLLTGTVTSFGWDWRSFGVAVLGAVILLFITGAARKKT
jgi:uncharacterized membrane protein YeaQ/YmgE (transglycosylase-associated protein family)